MKTNLLFILVTLSVTAQAQADDSIFVNVNGTSYQCTGSPSENTCSCIPRDDQAVLIYARGTPREQVIQNYGKYLSLVQNMKDCNEDKRLACN